MKQPFFEIIDTTNEILILLIEDILDQDDQFELNKNYESLILKTNHLISQLDDYFKFESIHSLKESAKIRELCKNYYKVITTDKGNGSIYSNLIHNPNFDYKSIIYDESDKPSVVKSIVDKIKVSKIESHLQQKEKIEIENVNLFSKPGKGQKLCKKCKKVIGARSMICKYCKQECK